MRTPLIVTRSDRIENFGGDADNAPPRDAAGRATAGWPCARDDTGFLDLTFPISRDVVAKVKPPCTALIPAGVDIVVAPVGVMGL